MCSSSLRSHCRDSRTSKLKLVMNSSYGHAFLELCCASDSELAAAKVKHSVAIRATSPEDLQHVGTRRVLHRLLRICKTYDVL